MTVRIQYLGLLPGCGLGGRLLLLGAAIHLVRLGYQTSEMSINVRPA